MPRAPVLKVDMSLDGETRRVGKPDDSRGKEQRFPSSGEKLDDGRGKKQRSSTSVERPNDSRSAAKPINSSTKKVLTYDRAEAFYGIRMQLRHD